MKIPFRNVVAHLFSCYLILNGKLKILKRRCEKGEIILSVYFHNPSKKLFTKCVKWFIKNGYHFISTDDLQRILIQQLEFPKSAVIMTIDDGWKENKENIFSVVEKYSIPISLFVTTQPIEKQERFWWTIIAKSNKDIINNKKIEELKIVPNEVRIRKVMDNKYLSNAGRDALTFDELMEISDMNNVSIGSHTVTHPILPMCNDNDAEFEIYESKSKLEKWLNRPITHFAYPNGDYTKRECAFLRKAGYSMAFTTNPIYLENTSNVDLFQIPRFGVVDNIPFTENLCRMTGIWYERKNFKK